MKMILKLLIVCILCLITIVLIYFVGVLIYSTLTEFKPVQNEKITTDKSGIQTIPSDGELSIITWNIGYGGLGKEMDFFYEGGEMTKPSKSQNQKYLNGITDFISKNDSIDFILLQEVDFDSKRSYYSDQSGNLHSVLPEHYKILTYNYRSKYIPVPFLNPMGKVNSGLVTFSKFSVIGAQRMATPGSYSWPKKLFMLKRCFLISRYQVENNKELVLLNIHNSAFDDAGEFRKEELKLLKTFILNEYEKGNYVVAGGDWNQNPPGSTIKSIRNYKSKEVWPIEDNYLPDGWNWAYDPYVPTNRDVIEPFDPKSTTCTVLDYFVISPNIKIINTKAVDLGFEFSDHQPVIIKIQLNLKIEFVISKEQSD